MQAQQTKGFYRGVAQVTAAELKALRAKYAALLEEHAAVREAVSRTVWASPGHVLSVLCGPSALPEGTSLFYRCDHDGRWTWWVATKEVLAREAVPSLDPLNVAPGVADPHPAGVE